MSTPFFTTPHIFTPLHNNTQTSYSCSFFACPKNEPRKGTPGKSRKIPHSLRIFREFQNSRTSSLGLPVWDFQSGTFSLGLSVWDFQSAQTCCNSYPENPCSYGAFKGGLLVLSSCVSFGVGSALTMP